jgi:hypothetical protein
MKGQTFSLYFQPLFQLLLNKTCRNDSIQIICVHHHGGFILMFATSMCQGHGVNLQCTC